MDLLRPTDYEVIEVVETPEPPTDSAGVEGDSVLWIGPSDAKVFVIDSEGALVEPEARPDGFLVRDQEGVYRIVIAGTATVV